MPRTKCFRIGMPAVVLAVAALGAGCGAPDAPAPRADEVLQAGAGLHWYRGNLHTHTRWSDGDGDADAVASWYREHGYDFLAITEHDRVPDDADWQALVAAQERPGAFVLIRGEEISNFAGSASVHLNAFGLARTIAPVKADDVVAAVETTAATLAAVPHAPGAAPLLQLNHPNFWYSVTAEHLLRLRGVGLVEVFNAHELSESEGDGLRPPVERLWDIALAWRLDVLGLPPLYGTATDDSHALPDSKREGARPGRAWVMVLADRLEPAALLDALRRGRFYASSGVELQRIVATPAALQVDVAAEEGVEYVIEFIGTRRGFPTHSRTATMPAGGPVQGSRHHDDAIGTVFARVEGRSATYRLQPDDLYVRARVTASTRHGDPSVPLQFERAWVQPLVGPAGRSPNRPGETPPAAVAPSLHAHARLLAPVDDAALGTLTATAGAACSLDVLADSAGRAGPSFARTGGITVGGWLLDPGADRRPDSLTVLLQGDRAYAGGAGASRARPDVAKVFGKPGFEAAGFHVGFGLDGVEPGEYAIALVAHYDGRSRVCDTGKSLRVE